MGPRLVPRWLLIAGIALSMLPDADAIGFYLGIPYSHMLGHRGATHSLLFAMLLACLTCLLPVARKMRWRSFVFLSAAAVSHGFLDALTNGGLGVGFFIPWDDARYFFPWRPLKVSPMGVREFLGSRGVQILASEFYTIWLPCLVIASAIVLARRRFGQDHA